MRRQEVTTRVAGVPSLGSQVGPPRDRDADRHLPGADVNGLGQRRVFRSFRDLKHERTAAGQWDLATAVDVMKPFATDHDVPAHGLVAAERELSDAAKRHVLACVWPGDANSYRRRLSRRSIIDAEVDVEHSAIQSAIFAPTLTRILRNASTAFGNRSGPVTPLVGPPPRRCGSSVAKPS